MISTRADTFSSDMLIALISVHSLRNGGYTRPQYSGEANAGSADSRNNVLLQESLIQRAPSAEPPAGLVGLRRRRRMALEVRKWRAYRSNPDHAVALGPPWRTSEVTLWIFVSRG